MTDAYAQLLHGIAVLLGVFGLEGPGVVLATLGAVALVGALGLVSVALSRVVGVAGPRQLRVGARSRRHAVLLGHLPDASHPDARGHIRSRAPGQAVPAA